MLTLFVGNSNHLGVLESLQSFLIPLESVTSQDIRIFELVELGPRRNHESASVT